MWHKLILLVWFQMIFAEGDQLKNTETVPEVEDTDKFGTGLVTQLRNDANLDLSQDEEYEDLRAELLAYHTALAKLSDTPSRRSMKSTPCWRLGGVCIDRKMCNAARQVFQANACRDKREVCCFAWNRAIVQENKDLGLQGPYPWQGHNLQPFEGKGLVSQEDLTKLKKKKKKALSAVQMEEKSKENNKSSDEDNNEGKKKKSKDDKDVAGAIAGDTDAEVKSNTETLALIIRSL